MIDRVKERAMVKNFSIPDEYKAPFRRILPYLSAPLQKDPEVQASLLLYYKLGGEKMARIVIDALNVTERIQYSEMIKRLREEALLNEHRDGSDEDPKENEGDAGADADADVDEGGDD
jgi:hypothetical protein